MKKVSIIALIILSFCSTLTNCQTDTIKNGAYLNCVDFNNNKPLCETDFIFKKKNNKKIPELYKVKSKDAAIKMELVHNAVWGIMDSNSFYLNAGRLGMKDGYIKITKFGRYSYFKGAPIKSLEQNARLNNATVWFGATGAVVTGAIIASENKDNIHYILNIKSGMINLLNKNYILWILQPYGDLLFNFQQEENNESVEILLKYIDLLNNLNE